MHTHTHSLKFQQNSNFISGFQLNILWCLDNSSSKRCDTFTVLHTVVVIPIFASNHTIESIERYACSAFRMNYQQRKKEKSNEKTIFHCRFHYIWCYCNVVASRDSISVFIHNIHHV